MSIFDRFVARPRPLWVNISMCILLILAPIVATALDGEWDSFLAQGGWRPLLAAPIVIIYIVVASQILARSDAEMLKAFRPVVLIDDDSFDRLVREESRVNPAGELAALAVGALLGLALSLAWMSSIPTFWLRLYVPVSLSLMLGLLGWTIYASIASTRLIAALHRQPLNIDILDTSPFEPIGRYSLVTALVFVGGITLGMVFGIDLQNVLAWQTWLVFAPLLAVPVIVFYLSMRGTHHLLAAEKRSQLRAVERRLQRASHEVQAQISAEDRLGRLASEYPALIAYEARLRAASTWPYNTAMLRTLFFTILVPLVVRGLSVVLFGQ